MRIAGEVSDLEKESIKVMARNREAYHEYFVLEKFEAGIELVGTEVKSIRAGRLNLKESWCMIKNGEMLEYALYNGNYYGTPRKTVEKMLDEGTNVLLEIEPQGALKVKSLFADANLIFIVPPSMAELKRRLIERGREDEEQIIQRMAAAKWEFEQSAQYNYILVNDDLEKCVCEVCDILHDKIEKRDMVEKLLVENY